MNKSLIILIGSTLILNGCNSKYGDVIPLDDFKKDKLTYDELPENVKDVYEQFAQVELLKDTMINNMSLSIELYKPTLHENQFGLMREGFNHIFVIDNSYALKLKANKGDPFVFLDNSLFYTKELNLDKSNYKYSDYIKIDLADVLTKHKGDE